MKQFKQVAGAYLCPGRSILLSYKKDRRLKVYEISGPKYKSTPTIMLKGEWLKELGFDCGDRINVECQGGKLIITKTDEVIVE